MGTQGLKAEQGWRIRNGGGGRLNCEVGGAEQGEPRSSAAWRAKHTSARGGSSDWRRWGWGVPVSWRLGNGDGGPSRAKG